MTREQIYKEPRLSKDMRFWEHMKDIDVNGGVEADYWFKSEIAKDWRFVKGDIDNPVSNTDQQYLHFINSSLFREEADYFEKHGCYTQAIEGTYAYNAYWDEQERRCNEGYILGGVRISGRMYFMLNFSRMRATKIDPKTGQIVEYGKKIRFPRFLDHQYYAFNEMERALGEGPYKGSPKQSMCIVKSRRKGMTYVVAAGLIVYNYTFVISSNNIIAAGETDHYKATADAIWFTVNHLNGHTEFGQNRHKKNTHDYFRASYIDRIKGKEVECGSLAEVRFASFKDNAFKSIGESVDLIGFEEAGKFKNLIKTLRITEPTYRDGAYYTGCAFIWGTGGDMTSGGSLDLSKIFYKPKAYGFLEYENIYDDHKKGTCGWFIDDMWYYLGEVEIDGEIKQCVDAQGNSYREYAEILLDEKRELSKGEDDYDTTITQQPKTPSEAFMVTMGGSFPVKMISDRINELQSNKIEIDARWVGRFKRVDGKLDFVHDYSSTPVDIYPIDAKDNKYGNLEGAIVLYSKPDVGSKGLVFKNRYLMGVDPYAQDTASSVSVGAVYVFDRVTRRIVAEYVGRPENTDEFHTQVMNLAIYYNAKVNYENMVPGFDKVFEKNGYVHLLAEQPEYLKSISPNSKVQRPYGCHASAPIIVAYIALIKNWLLSYDEIMADGRNLLESIVSIGLLEEMRQYSQSGNFDRLVALGMVLILDKEYENLDIVDDRGNLDLNGDNVWLEMAIPDKGKRDEYVKELKVAMDSGFLGI